MVAFLAGKNAAASIAAYIRRRTTMGSSTDSNKHDGAWAEPDILGQFPILNTFSVLAYGFKLPYPYGITGLVPVVHPQASFVRGGLILNYRSSAHSS